MNTTLTIVGGLVAIAVVIVPYLKNKLMKIVTIGFYLSILGSLLVGFAPPGTLASAFLSRNHPETFRNPAG